MITIILPFPDGRLNPNRSNGKHWGSTTALRKKARSDAHWISRTALLQATCGRYPIAPGVPDIHGDVALVITFVQPDRRARDRDNLLSACKPQLDGVADALGINDARFNPVTIRREFGAKPGMTRIEIKSGEALGLVEQAIKGVPE